VRVQLDCTNGYNLRYALNQVLHGSPPETTGRHWGPVTTPWGSHGTHEPMGSPLGLRGNAFFASNRFEDVVVGLRRAEQLLRASAAHLSFRT